MRSCTCPTELPRLLTWLQWAQQRSLLRGRRDFAHNGTRRTCDQVGIEVGRNNGGHGRPGDGRCAHDLSYVGLAAQVNVRLLALPPDDGASCMLELADVARN